MQQSDWVNCFLPQFYELKLLLLTNGIRKNIKLFLHIKVRQVNEEQGPQASLFIKFEQPCTSKSRILRHYHRMKCFEHNQLELISSILFLVINSLFSLSFPISQNSYSNSSLFSRFFALYSYFKTLSLSLCFSIYVENCFLSISVN